LFGILTGFVIRHKNINLPQANFVYNEVFEDVQREFVINGLLQFTNYSVEVAAVTIGTGVFSELLVVRTDQDGEFLFQNCFE